MAVQVRTHILSELASAKYFAIIVDSTPDLTHTDQLTFIVRYVSKENEPVEHFLTYLQIDRHTSEHLADKIVHYMESVGLDILDCRGQSCDNASNMAGKYSGLQARIKELNPLAEFVPCAAHSLNLVVVKVVECDGKVLDFFTFLQKLYTFFSASTYRWNLLLSNMKKGQLTLKSRAATRWCANAAATKALKDGYTEIMQVLLQISEDKEETPSTRSEAGGLSKKMQKFETALWVIVWDTLLQRIDGTNQNLQSPSLDVSMVPEMYEALIEYVLFLREKFEMFEEKACALVGHNEYSSRRPTKRTKYLDDGPCGDSSLEGKDAFRVSCFNVVCDNMVSNLKTRMSTYQETIKKFSFLFCSDKDEAYDHAKKLQNIYCSDLEEEFAEEYLHLFPLLQHELSAVDKLKKMHKLSIIDTFANVETALKLFLTLPVSNCSGERSFSALKRIKYVTRTTLADDKLSSLALLSIEGDITMKIDFSNIIKDFVLKKMRREFIKYK